MGKVPKIACIDCQFLQKESIGYGGDTIHQWSVSISDRKAIRKYDFLKLDNYSLGCHMGVWNEGQTPENRNREKDILDAERTDYCFFWKFRPCMFFQAALTLQRREEERREASRDRRHTIIGL